MKSNQLCAVLSVWTTLYKVHHDNIAYMINYLDLISFTFPVTAPFFLSVVMCSLFSFTRYRSFALSSFSRRLDISRLTVHSQKSAQINVGVSVLALYSMKFVLCIHKFANTRICTVANTRRWEILRKVDENRINSTNQTANRRNLGMNDKSSATRRYIRDSKCQIGGDVMQFKDSLHRG